MHWHVYQELLPMHTKGVGYCHEGLVISSKRDRYLAPCHQLSLMMSHLHIADS